MGITSTDETILTRLTPPGRGAIATLAVAGPRAWDAVRELFMERQLPATAQPNRIWYGKLGDENHGADEVIIAVKRENPPYVEIHCHGGTEIVALLTKLLKQKGINDCDWRDFSPQTGDSYKALAQQQLAKAPTFRTASILLDQYHGAFRDRVAEIVSNLEAERIPKAASALAELTRYDGLGRHLTEPWKIVIAGAPNVGKSSLVNALAGYERAIVSPIPGTTRDVVSTTLAIDGWPVEIFDTAGWRHRAEMLEQAGIDNAKKAVSEADLCLWVLDGTGKAFWREESNDAFLFVINKTDLPAAWDFGQAADAVQVSAKTGDGLNAMCETIASKLVPDSPAPKAAMPFTPELCDHLKRAETALAKGDAGNAIQALRALR